MNRPAWLLVAVSSALAGCQAQGPKTRPARGRCRPRWPVGRRRRSPTETQAREAFTRRAEDGTFAAALEDVAWLRFLGTPAEVERDHRAYFEEGYTTFQIELNTDEFTQPTKETFTLEDSAGRRVVGRPHTYKSAMSGTAAHAFLYHFSVSFPHAITADTQWLRLTRTADGTTLRWELR